VDARADAARARARLPEGIRLGALGWIHPEWGELVWSTPTDAAALERDGLAEYAAHPLFGTLGLDLGPEGLSERDLRRYAALLGGMPVAAIAPAVVTLPRFPRTAPFAHEGGRVNPSFLDAHHFTTSVWRPLTEALGEQLAVVLLSFPPALAAAGIPPAAFAERLERFLGALPPEMPVAVELREPKYLGLEYARVLATANASHVFTSAPGMPTYAEQELAVPTSPEVVVRLDDPLEAQYPSETQRRAALVELLRGGTRPAFVLVGDHAEGSAPRTIARLTEALAAEPSGER
jgi:hypothetical protein